MPVLGPNIALGAHARGKGGGAAPPPDDGGLATLQSVFVDGNTRRGYAFAPWLLDTLFVERTGAAATTPAGVGDFVGTIRDVSGNGWYATAVGDSKRGVLSLDGNGNYYIAMDGIDDGYRIVGLVVDTTQYDILAFNQSNAAKPFWIEHGGNVLAIPGHFFYGSSNATWVCNRSPAVQRVQGVANWGNGLHVSERKYIAAAGGEYSRDGVVQANGTVTGAAVASSDVTQQLNLFSRAQTSNFSEGAWYGSLLCDKSIPSTAQITAIRELFAQQSGVSL